MTTKVLEVNFNGDVGSVIIRAVAGDANSRKLVLAFTEPLPAGAIVRLFVKKSDNVEYVEAENSEIILAASMLEKSGVYPAQIEVLEKDGDEVRSIIQTRAFNLIVEKSISSLEAVEGTANVIDIANIASVAQDVADLKTSTSALENGKENKLPEAGENADNKFLNGQKQWIELESIQGENGKSAYQIAVDGGFSGSKAQWLESLKGADGQDGQDGQNGTDGEKGDDGEDGKSAYQIWLDSGNSGTEQDFIDSLKGQDGENGKSAYEMAKDEGYPGDKMQFLDDIRGDDGKSAYQIAQDNGFVGSEAEWLASLKGQNGTDGADGNDGADGQDGQSINLVKVADEQTALAQSQANPNNLYWW